MERNDTTINKKLKYFFENKTLIHVSCNNKRFYNGTILLIDLKKDLFVISDRLIGDIPILFKEVNSLEPYVKEEGK